MGDEAGVAIGVITSVLFFMLLIIIAANTAGTHRILKATFFPSGYPQVTRACPHCIRGIHAQARVCPFCKQKSEPWVPRDGRWWRRTDEGDEYFDSEANAWRTAGESSPTG